MILPTGPERDQREEKVARNRRICIGSLCRVVFVDVAPRFYHTRFRKGWKPGLAEQGQSSADIGLARSRLCQRGAGAGLGWVRVWLWDQVLARVPHPTPLPGGEGYQPSLILAFSQGEKGSERAKTLALWERAG